MTGNGSVSWNFTDDPQRDLLLFAGAALEAGLPPAAIIESLREMGTQLSVEGRVQPESEISDDELVRLLSEQVAAHNPTFYKR
jgi:hypothetical protein